MKRRYLLMLFMLNIVVASLFVSTSIYMASVEENVEQSKTSQMVQRNGEFSYILLEDGTVSIIGYIGEEGYVVTIPSEIDGKPVTAVKGGGFSVEDLEEISFPDTVKIIGDRAFADCEALEKVTLSKALESIGKGAFWGCTQLKEIQLPDTVNSIGDSAFGACYRLKKIVIPNGVTAIGNNVFEECSALLEISIPNSVAVIGKRAFALCENLEKITIPIGVTNIGDEAFYGCSSLEQILITDSVTTIGKNVWKDCDKVVIQCKEGSYAKEYAKKNKIKYQLYVYKPTRETTYSSYYGDEYFVDYVGTWAYNDKGMVTRYRWVIYNEYTGEKRDYLYRYIYNEDGALKAEKYYEDGKYIKKIRYIYNKNGTLKAEKFYVGDVLTQKILYTYNKNNQLIKKTSEMINEEASGLHFLGDYSYVEKYEYDADGNLIYEKEYRDGKLYSLDKYKYADGNLVRFTQFDGNRKPTSLSKYTDYDSNGNWLRKVHYNYNKKGKAVLDEIEKYKYNSKNQQIMYKSYDKDRVLMYGAESEYNEWGDLIREKALGIYSFDATYEYKYDEYGNIVEERTHRIAGDPDYRKVVYQYKKILIEE